MVGAFIERYSRPGEIVLDPFCGSGITAIEAILSGRRTIALDLNPMATFITRMSLTPVDLKSVEEAFFKFRRTVKPQIDCLYETKCSTCGGQAQTTHTIWRDGRPEAIWYTCSSCRTKKAIKDPDDADLDNIRDFDKLHIPFWYPTDLLLENPRINVGPSQTIADLFSRRNLYALSLLFNAIETMQHSSTRDLLKFVFTAALPQASKMVFVIRRRGKLTNPSPRPRREEVGSWVIGYWIPPEHFEINVWNCFKNAFNRVIRGKRGSNHPLTSLYRPATNFDELRVDKTALILTQTATDLSAVPDNSVDYVFTDPPHGDRIPYFELSLLWVSWLRLPIDFENEIVISNAKQRNKNLQEYKNGLHASFQEIARVVKTGKFVSFAFNNLDDDTWLAVLDICLDVGFEIEDIVPMRYSASSVVQNSRKRGLKSDFVISCRNVGPRSLPTPNIWVEPIDSLKASLQQLINNVQVRDEGLETYQILNYLVPPLLKTGRAFRISTILGAIQQTCSLRHGRWYPRPP